MLTDRPPNLNTLPPLQLPHTITPLASRHPEMASPPSKKLSNPSHNTNVTLPGIHSLLTPPNSGHTGRLRESFDSHDDVDGATDPQIFSSNDDLESSTTASQAPLFNSESFEIPPDLEEKLEAEEQELIRNYMETHAPTWEEWEKHTGLCRPSQEDYYLMWSFIRTFRMDAENQLPLLERKMRITLSKREPSTPRDSAEPKSRKRKALQDTSPNRRTTTNIAPKAPSTPTPASASFRAKTDSPHASRPRKRSTKSAEESGEPKTKAARAKASKPETSHDFNDYPDWAPSTFDIENPTHHAQAVKRFSGGYNDLSSDPNRPLLDPVEVEVAEHLSLNCAKYLCAKRQIFKGYVDLLVAKAEAKRRHETHTGNWNKTAVQQLGNVDVNKMSALFTFFKDVGWFREELFTRLVEQLVQENSSS